MPRRARGPAALLLVLLPAAAIVAAAAAGASSEWRPEPPSPGANPLTPEKAELGRHLFFDRRLSGPGNVSCATCHRPELAFTDGRGRAVGATGEPHLRGAPGLANVAWATTLTWADPRVESLEQQARIALFGTDPVEMGATGLETEILARLTSEPRYAELRRAAFPGEAGPLTLEHVIRALASFERTLVSVSSPYDRLLLFDEPRALTDAARRGMGLFFSSRTDCHRCHAGLGFTGASRLRSAAGSLSGSAFQNTHLASQPGLPPDSGLARVTGRDEDAGRFRVPSLRNVAVTAPYMHDGRFDTLEQVVGHYVSGGSAEDSNEAPGNGALRRGSALIRPLDLDEHEQRDLVAFLESLTDESFLSDRRHRDPWPAQPRADQKSRR